jgi:hypothetical protein
MKARNSRQERVKELKEGDLGADRQEYSIAHSPFSPSERARIIVKTAYIIFID